MPRMVNPFELPGEWYKANLHTHTTRSDGQATVEERVEQYRRAGYRVLAITDHERTCDASALSDGRMLVVGGMEYHPPGPGNFPFHLVGLNVPPGFALADGQDANACIAEVKAAGGETVLAHPSWCGMGFDDFRHLRGLVAVEVYNATCDRHGRPSSESEWSIALDRGWALPAIGVDDAHGLSSEDVCECWTWLRMGELSASEVLRALRTGACYASCGPQVEDFRVRDGQVVLRCTAAAAVQFVGPPGHGARCRPEGKKTVTGFAMELRGWPYVRAVVTDPAGRRAWTNPIYFDGR